MWLLQIDQLVSVHAIDALAIVLQEGIVMRRELSRESTADVRAVRVAVGVAEAIRRSFALNELWRVHADVHVLDEDMILSVLRAEHDLVIALQRTKEKRWSAGDELRVAARTRFSSLENPTPTKPCARATI